MVNDKLDNNRKNFWGRILNRKKNLTDKEAEVMMNVILDSRKERGFRK